MTATALDAGAEPSLRPYQAIHEHSELELELAGRGEIASLVALSARWEQLTAALPAQPPPAAAPLLERALLIHERTRVELIRLRSALLSDLDTSRRAKRTADGYAGQLPGGPRVDRSA
jgi:hypothetical protein